MTPHLPDEVLEHILSFTELVAPFQLEWCPDRGLSPFDCCKTCNDSLEGCCCSFYHAAYATGCTCWRLPLSIFLVNKRMNRIATSIFYSKNTFFIATLHRSCVIWSLEKPLSVPTITTEFFNRLPSQAFPHLRSITVGFLDSRPHFALTPQAMMDWKQGIDIMTKKLDLPKLTLSLEIKVPRYLGDGWLQACHSIVHPLVHLGRIKRLFIYLSGLGNRYYENEGKQYETTLEKTVLGDKYDAVPQEKYDAKLPLWYDGYSREGPVYQADGREVWAPPEDGDSDYYYDYYGNAR
ncbi:hypothetical protein BDV36DRAFT_310027 [Aspergillus pseudocaelatus]|uniref:F-box domain-containing protein n=1 Tax=Aspergillus pseudocaelatus TaxID=1825620 RepID=A0ABQ6WHD3_9EURO|nr:hypothetical protein BDV36DRAFT_310027 [Aspergillus pseudocaelatus]